MRNGLTLRLTVAVAVAGLVLGAAGCSTATVRSQAPASPSSGAPASPSSSGAASASSTAAASPSTQAVVPWPAPADPMGLAVRAGLKPGPREFLQTNHVHAHLDVFVDGKPITVPAGIGIKIDDPAVHRFDETDGTVSYGGINLCNVPCISPLHTHDVTGILHTESSTPTPNTLGEFFIEWDVALSESCVGTSCSPTKIAIYVNGDLYSGDPRAIELTDHKEIAIVIGTPPPEIPKTADFSKA